MEQEQTWRDLLGARIRIFQERQRIASFLHINPLTLTRWATGKSQPRPDTLRLLLDAFPEDRELLTGLLIQEFPDFTTSTLSSEAPPVEQIPGAFYSNVFSLFTNLPLMLRESTICIAILQQMLGHLNPQQVDMEIFIVQCVPPRSGHSVRSMRMTWRKGIGYFSDNEHQTLFFGIETPIGDAATKGYRFIARNREEMTRAYPFHNAPAVASMITVPLLQANRIAGCICIVSSRPDYFSRAQLDLVQDYANVLVVAFEPDAFYNHEDIRLAILPSPEAQTPLLARFQQRVVHAMLQATQERRPLTRIQAEVLVWQELEDEFLQLVYAFGKQSIEKKGAL